MVSRTLLERCGRGATLVLGVLLMVTSPAYARDIIETPSSLFFGTDEENGIQMAQPDDNIRPFVVLTFLLPREHLFDDFSESSVRQFQQFAVDIGREAVRPRFNPFRASWLFDTEEDTYVISDRALGPLLAERPTTMGRGKLSVGFSYRQVNYDRYNGTSLDSLKVRVQHQDVPYQGSDPMDPPFVDDPINNPFRNCDINPVFDPRSPLFNPNDPRLPQGLYPCGQERDFVDVDIRMKIEQDFVDFYLEYGVTDSWDIGVVVPLVQTNFEIDAQGTIKYDPQAAAEGFSERTSSVAHAFCRRSDSTSPIILSRPSTFQTNPLTTPQQQGVIIQTSAQNLIFRCPNRPGDLSFGTPASPADAATVAFTPGPSFRGPVRDSKNERAIGIGDVRFRSKWHAVKSDGAFVPDLAWVSELRTPTGIEDDLQGTGAFSALNFIVGSWHVWRFHPHFNVGVDVSTGPAWQDGAEWILGVDTEVFEWLGLSVDYLGRIPFDDIVAERHEVGGGVKLMITPGVALSFDALFPLNKNEGLTSDIVWRVGGQVHF